MSTNIDHVECLSGELTISDEGREWVRKAAYDENSDLNWFPDNPPKVRFDNVVIVSWSGERSGNAAQDGTLAKFFSLTKGTAEFAFHWHKIGVEGIRVVDGVMTKHEVEMKLGKEIK